MINSDEIKKTAKSFGADLCGIAPIERFSDSPKGFHPRDIYKKTESVIAIACRVPDGSIDLDTFIPYTVIEELALSKVSQIALSLSLEIEARGSKAVMIPSVPYDYWDAENLEGKGILSLKHLGLKAGLGFMGRNTLLCNGQYGNLIRLGAVLTDAVLSPDEMQKGELCRDSCDLCVTSCPVGAIGNSHVSQKKCRPYSEVKNKRGIEVCVCNVCRKVCPNRNGIK